VVEDRAALPGAVVSLLSPPQRTGSRPARTSSDNLPFLSDAQQVAVQEVASPGSVSGHPSCRFGILSHSARTVTRPGRTRIGYHAGCHAGSPEPACRGPACPELVGWRRACSRSPSDVPRPVVPGRGSARQSRRCSLSASLRTTKPRFLFTAGRIRSAFVGLRAKPAPSLLVLLSPRPRDAWVAAQDVSRAENGLWPICRH